MKTTDEILKEKAQQKNLPFKGSTKEWVKGVTVTGRYPNRKQRRLKKK
jgi:hypothetical protein